MNHETGWRAHFQAELDRAQTARQAGNEGMARVCARRAAGWVVGEYMRRQGIPDCPASAYDRLRALQAQPGNTEDVRLAVQHFLARITPEHTLPVEADLIAEARWLAERLLGPDS